MENLINEVKKQGLQVYKLANKESSWVFISDSVRVVYAQKNIYNIGYDVSARCKPQARTQNTGSGYLLKEEITNLKNVDFWSLLDMAQRPANFYNEKAKKEYKPATIKDILKDAEKFGNKYILL